MSEKKHWTDAGRDCDYCGDIILKRDAPRTERDDDHYFRCVGCNRHWSSSGKLVYRGQRLNRAERILRQETTRPGPGRPGIPRWLLYSGGGLVVLFLLFRLGLLAALLGVFARFLIPVLYIAVPVIFLLVIYRLGKEYGWWDRMSGS